MPLHLVKLCVGVSALDEFDSWFTRRMEEKRRRGEAVRSVHTTRMIPRRAGELLDGGSLYWVIKGNIQVRQPLLGIEPFTDGDGIRRCRLVLAPKLVPTAWQPRRAFQGWRYLKAEDAPADLGGNDRAGALPPALRLELAELGLL